jgi:hypothetical protein
VLSPPLRHPPTPRTPLNGSLGHQGPALYAMVGAAVPTLKAQRGALYPKRHSTPRLVSGIRVLDGPRQGVIVQYVSSYHISSASLNVHCLVFLAEESNVFVFQAQNDWTQERGTPVSL